MSSNRTPLNMVVISIACLGLSTGSAKGTTPKFLKEIDEKIIQPTAKGAEHLAKEAGGEVKKAAESVGDAVEDVDEGLRHAAKEAEDELSKAARSVRNFTKKHETEIIVAVAVAAAVYTACATGCDVLISVGGASFKVGSVGSLATGAAAGVAAQALDTGSNGKEASPEDSQRPAEQAEAAVASEMPRANPETLPWNATGFLTLGPQPADSPDAGVAEALGDIMLDAASEKPWPTSRVEALLGAGGALVTISLTPSTVQAPEWNVDIEVGARLSELVRAAHEEAFDSSISGDEFRLEVVPNEIEMPPPPGPMFEPAQPEVRGVVLTRAEEIAVKSEIVAAFTGLSAAEVEQRVRAGVENDLKARNERLRLQQATGGQSGNSVPRR